MEKWEEKPRGFGEILDLTFIVLKNQFAKIFLIMLILLGPILLVQAIAMYSGGMPFFTGSRGEDSTFFDNFLTTLESSGMENAFLSVGGIELGILIVTLILLIIILLPVAMAAISILTKRVKEGEPIEVGPIIKSGFSRFWPLLGGSIVYMLISIALIGIPSVGFSLLFMLGTFSPIWIAVGIILGIAYIFGLVYFLTRWSFYFVAIIFEKVSPGISKSWHLTKGNFWRLLGLYLIINIISSIITTSLQMVSNLIFAGTVIGYLLNSLFYGFSYMITFVAYAVIYFDLKVRNEGADLQEMVSNYETNEVVDGEIEK